MFLKRLSSLVMVAAMVIAVAGLGEPALCAEAATEEQNLALLTEIEADLRRSRTTFPFCCNMRQLWAD